MHAELQYIRTETFVGLPFEPQRNGPYDLVRVELSLSDPAKTQRVWWDGNHGAIRELLGKENDPFTFVCLDFDKTIVDTERKGGFFDTAWAELFREHGIDGTTDQLADLKKLVYIWKNDVGTSTLDMLRRIESGRDVYGNELSPKTIHILKKLIRAYPQDDLETVAMMLADRKENLGAAIILNNPGIVERLAPLTPGVVDFLHALPEELPVAIGSASRRETIIKPILIAHDQLHPELHLMDRIGRFIVGEEISRGTAKPDDNFFNQMRWEIAHEMHRSGFKFDGRVFCVEDAVFIGDKAKIDVPSKRSMYHMIVNPFDQTGSYGPMTAVVPDFSTLLAMARMPDRQLMDNTTLRRMAVTLK